ncbi:serine/threonine-protein kinase MEC1-like [Melitaea cinxia]|uniref:serine/threonine-protein kinase MEC1-like n=1 Tax=Melitaea cinxia TaxID=113334 RepID=UPI001E26EA8D|nr:serine/threonine-protein kinase MEC1-like [Melitaea cinxia]
MRRDLKSLNKDHIESAMQEIEYKIRDNNNNIYDNKVLQSVCTLALTFYDQLWETAEGTSERNDLLHSMSKTLGLVVSLGLGLEHLSTDVIVNRLEVFSGDELEDEVAENLLDILQPIIKNVNTISLDILKTRLDLFKKHEDHETVRYLKRDESTLKYKMCLNLVGDAGHLLLQYCSKALKVLHDKTQWTNIFAELKENIFENPYAGTDYIVLEKYKDDLYDIAVFDSTDKETKKRILSSILSQPMETRSSVSLSHVCPALCGKEIADESLNKLLGLKSGVSVFKFEEKVPLFVDSIRRPAVLCVRLSDGSSRRYIVKRGERTRTHCAAVRLLAIVQPGSTVYNVTQLSEDSALIQYLEHHERFRTLIFEKNPIDAAVDTMTRARSKDSNLILSPAVSLRHFQALCQRVPAYMLRSAIEDHSACVQDFINKKKNFLEAISSMTMFSYLCGVGDRHLENIMYNLQDGRALPVDLDAILKYGANELPPARLTRNILAVCDTQILESRLQSTTLSLRESSKHILPSITVVFKWMRENYMEKLPYITSLIEGTSLSHLVTIDVISKSDQQYKEKYVQLLKDVFADFDEKDIYTVEEQVSSLLRQCTEPRILSVTRSGWEPWI